MLPILKIKCTQKDLNNIIRLFGDYGVLSFTSSQDKHSSILYFIYYDVIEKVPIKRELIKGLEHTRLVSALTDKQFIPVIDIRDIKLEGLIDES